MNHPKAFVLKFLGALSLIVSAAVAPAASAAVDVSCNQAINYVNNCPISTGGCYDAKYNVVTCFYHCGATRISINYEKVNGYWTCLANLWGYVPLN